MPGLHAEASSASIPADRGWIWPTTAGSAAPLPHRSVPRCGGGRGCGGPAQAHGERGLHRLLALLSGKVPRLATEAVAGEHCSELQHQSLLLVVLPVGRCSRSRWRKPSLVPKNHRQRRRLLAPFPSMEALSRDSRNISIVAGAVHEQQSPCSESSAPGARGVSHLRTVCQDPRPTFGACGSSAFS